MTREALVTVLRNNIAIVTFQKVNGDIREMQCTLKPSVIPPLKGSNHARNLNVVPVWDLEKDAWRSFRLDSVQSLEIQS